MTDNTQPEAGSTHIIRLALELGLLWIDGSGRDKVREALDALDALEAQLEAVGAGGVQALSAAPAEQQAAPKAAPAGFVPVAAFDRLHAHAESLAARLLAVSPTPQALSAAPAEQQAAPKAAPGEPNYSEKWDAELGRTAMRFVDRAGDVHPGIDDAETICAEFHRAMSEVIERMPHVQRMAAPQQEPSRDAKTWCSYVAGMIGCYLKKPDESAEVRAIAGIIERRLWALPAPQPAPAPLSDDTERLEWLLWKLPGDALRYVVGELSDTSSGAEFRAAIDAALAAQGGKA